MYAALGSAWNIIGGYSGYVSLGHAAFFGVGAYAVAIVFTHTGVGAGYRPFYILPARRSRRCDRGDPGGPRRVPHARGDLRDRHGHAALRRPAAGVQPALADERLDRARDSAAAVPGVDLRAAVLLRAARRARGRDARQRARSQQQARVSPSPRSATTRTGRAGSACRPPSSSSSRSRSRRGSSRWPAASGPTTSPSSTRSSRSTRWSRSAWC